MSIVPGLPGPSRRSEAGMMLVELMVSVTIMSVFVLGLITIMLAQSRQMAQDKILDDMSTYAKVILDEVEYSVGSAKDVFRGGQSGARMVEDLEFNYVGSTNFGQTLETRFTQDGERKVTVRENGSQTAASERFPPPELDPNRHRDLKNRIYVRSLQFRTYSDRPNINASVMNMLFEADLVLELKNEVTGYSIQRPYRRVIGAPNSVISINRLAQNSGS